MKNYILTFLCTCLATLFCQSVQAQTTPDKTYSYGAHFVPKDLVPATAVAEKLSGKDAIALQTTGTVKEVCQAKGCWIKIDVGNGQEMMVKFKDYAFFVPKDIAGKQVILLGKAFQKTIPVAQLQHYAEDAGKFKEEVAKITRPQTSLQFEAEGVILTEK